MVYKLEQMIYVNALAITVLIQIFLKKLNRKKLLALVWSHLYDIMVIVDASKGMPLYKEPIGKVLDKTLNTISHDKHKFDYHKFDYSEPNNNTISVIK